MANAFKNLLLETREWGPSINEMCFESIQREEVRCLERPFSNEVVNALVGMCGNQALGPDGFSMAFWYFRWHFVQNEMMGLFREFHEHGVSKWILNAAFLTLVPKKGGADDLKYFRSISLVGGLYKLLPKCWPIGSRRSLEQSYPMLKMHSWRVDKVYMKRSLQMRHEIKIEEF